MRRFIVFSVLLAMGIAPAALPAGDDAEAVKGLLQRLRKGDERAVPALVRHGEAAVPGLIEVLKEGNAEVQGNVMTALGQIGPAAKAAVPHLAEGLTESSNDVLAAQAATALGRIGAASVPELVKVLNKGAKGRAVLAARAIAQIGPAAKDAEPGLVDQLKAAKEPREEAIFIDALVALGPGAKDAVPALLALAKANQKTPVQIHVLIGLGKMGPAANEAVPYLAEVMADAKVPPHLRIHALQSLCQVAPSSKAIAEALPEMLKGGIWPRPIVIEMLAQTGPVTKDARTALEEAVSSKDAATRVYAAQGLGKGDPKDRVVASVLIESLREKNPQIRRLAAVAVGEVRPADPAVKRTLEKVAGDADPTVRQAAAAALKKLEKQ
jgi:HEAT repeat protein